MWECVFFPKHIYSLEVFGVLIFFFFFHVFWTANSLIILSKPWPFLEIHIFKKYLLSANFVPRHLGLGMGERQTINIINK